MERARKKVGRRPKNEAAALGDQIVDVADQLFIENGYGAISMTMIAGRARVGKQTLYRRFPDKAALFREVIRRRIDASVPAPVEIVTVPNPLGELKKIGKTVLDIVLHPDFARLYRMIIAEAVLFPELASAVSGHWQSSFGDRCVDSIRQAQAIGICRPGNPEILAQCFLWGLIGDTFLKGLTALDMSRSKEARDAHLRTVWSVFFEGVTSR